MQGLGQSNIHFNALKGICQREGSYSARLHHHRLEQSEVPRNVDCAIPDHLILELGETRNVAEHMPILSLP